MRIVLLLACLLAGCQAKPVRYELMEVGYESRLPRQSQRDNANRFANGAKDCKSRACIASSHYAR
jgi:hypothetical protein